MGIVDLRRHGDVLIFNKKDFEIPKDVDLQKGNLIHKGNNNSHVIQGEALIGRDAEKGFLRVLSDSIVSHVGGSSTHESKPIPKGDYWFEIQTYYDHLTEESKRVVD